MGKGEKAEFRIQNPESRKEYRMQKTGVTTTGRQGGARTFEDLIVWQRAHQFVIGVYRVTDRFPKSETYGLTMQFRRAAVSIPANIAEGFKKRGQLDKMRFLNIAQGSLEECRYYLILARDLGYGHDEGLLGMLQEVSKLLEAYTSSIRLNSNSCF